jgi:hypothetical protein
MKLFKKIVIISALLCCSSKTLEAVPYAVVPWDLFEEYSAQSFMFTKPVYANVAMQQSLWHDIIYNKPGRASGAFQITGMFQQTRPDDATGRFFLINHKNTLLITGDTVSSSINKAERDIRAEWLNLPSDFSGVMGIDPYQRQFGVVVEYNQDLSFLKMPFFENFWISVSAPFITVTNRLNLMQEGISNPTPTVGGPNDILEAFNQPAWLSGKWPTCDRTKSGLAEIALRWGKAYMNEDYYQIAYYSVFKIPGHEGQDPTYLFDPVVGNNGHWGFGAGVNFQLVLNKDTSCSAYCWFLNIENIFLFREHQFRTFDLKNKPFSRYMLFTREGGIIDQKVPGVNLLTREVRIHPYNMADICSGLRYKTDKMEAEIGYSLWIHGTERLELESRTTKDVYGILGSAPGLTASGSTIDTQAADDAQVNPNPSTPGLVPLFVAINDSQIDLNSGASRSALVHKAHIAFGAEHRGCNCDYFIGGGLDFELPHPGYNSALKNMALWTKVGASF